jgi:hypothetical protein
MGLRRSEYLLVQLDDTERCEGRRHPFFDTLRTHLYDQDPVPQNYIHLLILRGGVLFFSSSFCSPHAERRRMPFCEVADLVRTNPFSNHGHPGMPLVPLRSACAA